MKQTKSILLVVCLILMATAALPLFAQTTTTGAITGTVTDSTGAVIPGATVTATSADTGQQRSVTTGADGSYKFPLVQPGTYNLKFSANGFKVTEVPKLTVGVTETPVLDQKLEIGTQSEQVTVEANAETLQTTSATLGGTVGGATMTALPLTTRNYTNILALSAGVAAGVTNASQLGVSGMDMAVNGATRNSNNISVDGQNVQGYGSSTGQTAGFGNGGYNPVPNPDALQEFKVQTATYDAGYGRSIGANVNVITKSGTNSVHGSAFEFLRNTSLNANDFFLNRSGRGKGVLNQNQFGGVLGGPIKKDKLFFFGSYQGTRQKNGVAAQGNSAVTLPPIPLGDRSNTAAFTQALGALMCPANHPGSAYTAVRGGVAIACDGSNINPVAINMLQTKFATGRYKGQYIAPGSTNGLFQSTNLTDPSRFKEDQYLANFDYIMSSKNTLAFRFFASNAPATIPFGGPAKGPGFTIDYLYRNWADVLKLTTVVTPSLVNEARLSFHRDVSNANGNDSGLSSAQFGIAPLSPALDAAIPGFMSQLIISGMYTIGGQFNGVDFSPENANSYQFGDQVSWTRGKHTVRVGFDAEAIRWHWNMLGLGAGNLNIGSYADFLIGRAGCAPADTTCSTTNPGNTNGTLFSNIASTSSADAMGPVGDPHSFRAKYMSSFVNDDIKVSQRLTVNAGLRYEYNGMLSDDHGVLTNFWTSAVAKFPTPPTASCTPACNYAGFVVPANYPAEGVYGQKVENLPGMTRASNNSSLENGPPKTNFGPRIGFAWQPTGGGKLVIRGGYGIFFDHVPGQSLVFGINNSPPLANAIGKNGTANFFSSLSQPFLPNSVGKFQDRWINFTTLQSSSIGQQNFSSDWKTPTLQSYNLGLQYNFLPSWVLELGYVGSKGKYISTGGVIDNGAISGIASVANPIWGVTTNTVANAAVRLPYLGYNSLRTQCTCFRSNFNSVQVTLRKQFSHGFQAQAAYTFARAFTNSGVTSQPNVLDANYGLDTNYRPQRLVINYSWNLPGSSVKGVLGKVVGGWSLSGITTIQGGSPLTLTDNRGGSIFGNFTTNGSLSRNNIAGNKTYADIATSGNLTDRLGGGSGGCGYFTGPTTAGTLNGVTCASLSPFTAIPNLVLPDGTVTNGTTWGNTGVGILLGPGQFNFDAALVKTTKVGGVREDATLQFRAEFFNMMNHAQFSDPATGQAAGTFGQITGTTVNPRLIQFALKYSF